MSETIGPTAETNMVDDPAISGAGRLCFFAHYHQTGLVADHVLYYLQAIRDAGFTIIVISTAVLSESESIKLRNACDRLIVRDNAGLDFGSWIEAYRRFAPIRADLLLLTNDSIYGPISSLPQFIEDLISVPADFYGAVECLIIQPHLQSWFVMLRPSAYKSSAFVRLFSTPIPSGLPKWDIIQRYEIAMTHEMAAEGLTYHSAYSPPSQGLLPKIAPYNPSHLVWRQIIERWRVPFLKIELLRRNPVWIKNVDQWRTVIEARLPVLASMIESDLHTRGRSETLGPIGALHASLDSHVPEEWPELQGYLIRDHDLPHDSRLVRMLNYCTFRLARFLSRRTRKIIKRLAPQRRLAT